MLIPRPLDATEGKRRGGRRLALVLLSLGAVSALIGAISFDSLPSTIGDNAEFAILARSLAAGEGLHYLNHPALLPATKYPPGFPLMLAMLIPLFGGSMVVMKVEVVVCYVLLVMVAFLLGRKLIEENLSLVGALMIATSAAVLPYSHEVLSDLPYALFSLLGLLLVINYHARRMPLLIGLAVCIWAYVVRTAGVSLVGAVALFLLLRHRRREACLLIAAFVIFSAAWMLRNRLAAGEGSRYLSVFFAANPYEPDLGRITILGFLKRVMVNLWTYMTGMLPLDFLPSIVGYITDFSARAFVSLVLLGVAGLGGFSLRKRAALVNLYLLAYMAVCLVWPEVWRSERFMLPIAPLVAVYFLAGIERICAYFSLRRMAVLLICIGLAATNLYSLVQYASRPHGYPPGWNNYFETAIWARDSTKPDAVVLTRSPFLYYIFSERRTIQYPFTRDAEAMRTYLDRWHPDYIVVDNSIGFPQTATYLVPVLLAMPDRITSVYSTPEPINLVLRYLPSGPGSGR